MKYYTYVEPTSATDSSPVYKTLSEDEIIKEYWDYFIEKLQKRGYNINNVVRQDCIDEWVIIHWAIESNE